MPSYRVSMMWNQSTAGVSETLYTPNVTLNTAADRIDALLRARNQLMYANQFWVGVRISQFGSQRRSIVLLPGDAILPGSTRTITVPTNGIRAYASHSTSPDQIRGVLQYALAYDTDKWSQRYLSGIPDSISYTEPATLYANGDPGWIKSYESYLNVIAQQGWQLRARLYTEDYTPLPPIGVTVQAAAPGLLGIVLDSTGAGGFTRGSKIALTRWRPPKGERASTLNGTWIIDSVNDTLVPGETILYLRGSAGIDPTRQRFTDTTRVQLVGYDLFTVSEWRSVRVCTHKRGRPSMAPRGRRLSRPTLDP